MHFKVGETTACRCTRCSREYTYFADQSLLEPYPRELVQMRDSGKGVDF